MIFNLIVGGIAGFTARYLESFLNAILIDKYKMSKADQRVLAFAVLLLGASVLISLGGEDGLPFALVFGAIIGFFHKYLWELSKEQYKVFKSDTNDDLTDTEK